MRKCVLALAVCVLLTGCSWWPWGHEATDQQESEAPPPAKTIGVISVISEHIAIIDINNAGWSRHSAIYPLAGWQIDEVATREVSNWLQNKGFDVRPVRVSTKAFSAGALGGPVSRGGWFHRSRPSFVNVIRNGVQPNDLDNYLVLVEASGSSNIPQMHGIGLVHFNDKPQAFVLYHAFLIDGKSGETLDDVHADAESEYWGQSSSIDGPNVDVPKAAWPEDVYTWTADQQVTFRQTIEAELSNSLQATLPRLDLP